MEKKRKGKTEDGNELEEMTLQEAINILDSEASTIRSEVGYALEADDGEEILDRLRRAVDEIIPQLKLIKNRFAAGKIILSLEDPRIHPCLQPTRCLAYTEDELSTGCVGSDGETSCWKLPFRLTYEAQAAQEEAQRYPYMGATEVSYEG